MNKQNKAICYILDDDLVESKWLEKIIKTIDILEIRGRASDPKKAMEDILNEEPEIIFMDIIIQGKVGFEIISEIRQNLINPEFIIVTNHKELAIRAIKTSVFDYLLKPIDVIELKETINRFLIKKSNKKIPYIKDTLIWNTLSERENEIVQYLIEGKTSEQYLIEGKTSEDIAAILFISKHTVDTHRRNILKKLKLKSTIDLFRHYNNS